MRITNKYDLPSVFEEFEKAVPYDPGKSDFTVTQLIDSPRVVQLRRSNSNKLEEDISERLFAILGSTLARGSNQPPAISRQLPRQGASRVSIAKAEQCFHHAA